MYYTTYCTTYSFEGNLDALSGSLYLCTTRRPLFCVSHSKLGPNGVSSDDAMYNTPSDPLQTPSIPPPDPLQTLGLVQGTSTLHTELTPGDSGCSQR
eukprot:1178103-Prorocentrum_minimum.AAC.1